MKDFLLSQLAGTDFFGTLIVWAVLVLTPALLFVIGAEYLRIARASKRPKEPLKHGRLYIGGASLALFVSAVLLYLLGAELVHHTREAFGPYMIGLLIASAVCIALVPICFIGGRLRLVWEYRRRKMPIQAKSAAKVAGIGIAVLVVVGVIFHVAMPGKPEIAFWIVTPIALAIGWLGGIFVPEL